MFIPMNFNFNVAGEIFARALITSGKMDNMHSCANDLFETMYPLLPSVYKYIRIPLEYRPNYQDERPYLPCLGCSR